MQEMREYYESLATDVDHLQHQHDRDSSNDGGDGNQPGQGQGHGQGPGRHGRRRTPALYLPRSLFVPAHPLASLAGGGTSSGVSLAHARITAALHTAATAAGAAGAGAGEKTLPFDARSFR